MTFDSQRLAWTPLRPARLCREQGTSRSRHACNQHIRSRRTIPHLVAVRWYFVID